MKNKHATALRRTSLFSSSALRKSLLFPVFAAVASAGNVQAANTGNVFKNATDLTAGGNYTTTITRNWGGAGYAAVPAYP